MSKPWQGRLPGATDASVERFTESISFDHRLYREDIAASSAHATMLAEVGLLTADEARSICAALAQIGEEIAAGDFPFEIAKEDIHMHIESALVERLGDVGRKLHAGRSRNDQVATDLRLWVRRQLEALDVAIIRVQRALLNMATRHRTLILPGYTHLQRAQPIVAAHYFLAHMEKYERDRSRIADCRRRVDVLPLGSAALAGTSLPIDRRRTAALLGFAEVARNSLDASCDRDFVLETAFVVVLIAEHLASWAEEWILWSTTEFDWLRLPDSFCTGSSIMPQKKNPDVLELIRGKSARVIGALQTLLVLVKGLPLAYNRDLQEDKPALFDAVETVAASLALAAPLIEQAEFNTDALSARLELGHLDATTLMEKLILLGAPMRSAHEIVGRLVRDCLDRRCSLAELETARYAELLRPFWAGDLTPQINDLKGALGVSNAVKAFCSEGSTGPESVNRQLDYWRARLNDSRLAGETTQTPVAS